MSVNLSREQGESELSYIWRLGNARENGLIDMTWDTLAEVLNKNLRDPDEYYTESVYRKRYKLMRQAYDEVFNKGEIPATDVDLCEEITLLRRELEKERVKLRDEKNDYRRLIREQARAETLSEYLVEAAAKLNTTLPLIGNQVSAVPHESRREAVVCFSDWHYGMETDNVWNKYNTEICVERVNKVLGYMKEYISANHISRVHVALLGDFAHGALHSCPLYSREDVCDQLMKVSEILAEAINSLSEVVDEVIVYSCYGNHMRTVQNKDFAKSSDNMEKIIPWWLEQRLAANDKVTITYSEYKEYTLLNVLGWNIVCVHGNDFDFRNIGTTAHALFTKLFGVNVDYTISGDKHHLEEYEKFGIESILIRSLCGTDDYANDKRLFGKAGQTLMIFNDDYGRECTYHIPVV